MRILSMPKKSALEGDVSYLIINTSKSTTAEVVLTTADGNQIIKTGWSSVAPGDKNNPEVGAQLALARALSSLAKTLEKQANGTVKSRDDAKSIKIKAQQESQADSKRAKGKRKFRRSSKG